MMSIVQREHPALRRRAQAVPPEDIPGRKIQALLRDMREALDREEDGVALAAPQIGKSLRIFIVSRKMFPPTAGAIPKDLVFINPAITKLSKKKVPMEEGCLSVRWLYGTVKRADKATVRAQDERGRPFTRGASGLLAQIFQHECDHLGGILFTDKATNIHELPPPAEKRKHVSKD